MEIQKLTKKEFYRQMSERGEMAFSRGVLYGPGTLHQIEKDWPRISYPLWKRNNLRTVSKVRSFGLEMIAEYSNDKYPDDTQDRQTKPSISCTGSA